MKCDQSKKLGFKTKPARYSLPFAQRAGAPRRRAAAFSVHPSPNQREALYGIRSQSGMESAR